MKNLFFAIFLVLLVSCSMPTPDTKTELQTVTKTVFSDPNYFIVNYVLWNGAIDYFKTAPYICYDLSTYTNKQIKVNMKFAIDLIQSGTIYATYYVSLDGTNQYESFTIASSPNGSFVEKSYILSAGNKIYIKCYADTFVYWLGTATLESYIISNF